MRNDVKILYIEDNAANVTVVERITASLGYKLTVAGNAMDGLKALYEIRPDIVLMDVGLPDMDGLTATQHIRSGSELQTIPVIAVTASAMVGDREKCLEAGCSDYLAKPYQVKDLVAIFNQWLPTAVK